MNLGVFLAIGESLGDLKSKGQLKRLLDYNIKKYSQNFDKVYIFSYANEKEKLPKNCKLIVKENNPHRYLYSLILPFLKKRYIDDCDVFRGLQLTGGIPAAICKVFFGKKFVINYGYDYSSFAKIEGKPIQSLLYKIIEKPIIKLADAVIVTSNEIKKTLREKRSKIVYIPNGVDINLFHPKAITKLNSILKLVYLGRLEKQKNLDSLINAAAVVKKPMKLTFYGTGTLKKFLLRLAKKLSVNLEIRPPVDYQDVPKALSSADVFVLPSFEEGNPKILLEAMAMSKPVIGANVKGIKELISHGQNGMLTGIDPKSIAKSITKLQDSSLRQKLGKNAREHIIKNYDINKLLTQEVNLLKKIAVK